LGWFGRIFLFYRNWNWNILENIKREKNKEFGDLQKF
jgi:hypothetical protein